MKFLATKSPILCIMMVSFFFASVVVGEFDNDCEEDLADSGNAEKIQQFREDVASGDFDDAALMEVCHGWEGFDSFTVSFKYECDSGLSGGQNDRPQCYPYSCTEGGASAVREAIKANNAEIELESCRFYDVTFDGLGPPPTLSPTTSPTDSPTISPSTVPTDSPTSTPSALPTSTPSAFPTLTHSVFPTSTPSAFPTSTPSTSPSSSPSGTPSTAPTSPPRMGTRMSLILGGFLLGLWYFVVIKNA